MKIIKVILDIQNNRFSKPLTYLEVDSTDEDVYINFHKQYLSQIVFSDKLSYEIKIGCMVVVPFGKQFKTAFVVDIIDANVISQFEITNLKPVLLAISDPFFNKENIETAKFISQKYLASFASCLRLYIPAGAVAKIVHKDNIWTVKTHKFRNPKNNFLDLYCSSQFQESKNWKDFVLTDDQNNALAKITNSINNKRTDVFVLDGVTSSGKTEVYLRAIKKVVEKNKTACVLVPEISLTPQVVSRFRFRFGEKIAVIHSKMSPSERFNQYKKIKDKQVDVVIGARSALFSPLENIGLIVIDEEHENSYKQDKAPRYRTIDCAEFIAKQQNAVLVLGSATPTFESLYKAKHKENWHYVQLLERTNKQPMPKIEVVDMGMEFKSGFKSLFSRNLDKSIIAELKAEHKVILFHNRRGYANYMFCRGCGYTPECPNCSITLTYHQKIPVEDIVNGKELRVPKQMLVCHHCGHMEHVPIECPECGSPYIAKYGAGTQSVQEQLEALVYDNDLRNVNIVRMDADTTKSKFGHQKCLESFAKKGPAVLLGTQMITKGLDFDQVTLVGIILIDTNLSLPDFRSSERTFNLILQVAGRAGRADLEGKVIVQTYNPENECISCAANYQKDMFVNCEMSKRKMMGYPPFVNLANIVVSGYKNEEIMKFANNLYLEFKKYSENDKNEIFDVMPATPCVLEKISNKYRYHILLKFKNAKEMPQIINNVINSIKIKSSIKLTVDIDPLSLF